MQRQDTRPKGRGKIRGPFCMKQTTKRKEAAMELVKKIKKAIVNHPNDFEAHNDLFEVIRHFDREKQEAECRWLRREAENKVRAGVEVQKFFELAKRTYLLMAPYDFDSFLIYIEWNRDPHKRFYTPRRHYLKKYVNAYQEILDGKLDFLSISMPKRAGKSQLGINFTNMLLLCKNNKN